MEEKFSVDLYRPHLFAIAAGTCACGRTHRGDFPEGVAAPVKQGADMFEALVLTFQGSPPVPSLLVPKSLRRMAGGDLRYGTVAMYKRNT